MLKTKTKVILSLAVLFPAAGAFSLNFIDKTAAVECTSSPCNTTFQVNVKETLSVSITPPASWASGDVDTFLRNKVGVSVSTNNASGFTASMYANTSASNKTDLVNAASSTNTISTLTSSWNRDNTSATNFWGYSLDDASETGTYNAMRSSTSPISIMTGNTSGSKDVYFGAKASMSKASGTYVGTVVINVVSGVKESTPTVPSNPATPNATQNVAVYNSSTGGSSNGTTTYTYSNTSGSDASATTTTTTQVSDGDNTSAYDGYTPPQGVNESTNSTESITGGSSLATGLAVTAAVAAAAGAMFFVLAKRRDDDDDEEEA